MVIAPFSVFDGPAFEFAGKYFSCEGIWPAVCSYRQAKSSLTPIKAKPEKSGDAKPRVLGKG